ncbi:heparin lyase I family protein [Novosphingobium sp.]|uniref:heparin lyase I family protein n=1 Tax=Novosphingobium sp. TaxID=1874826 RepID=UPI0038BCD738
MLDRRSLLIGGGAALAPGILTGRGSDASAQAIATGLLPAQLALRAGVLNLGPFPLRDASCGKDYSIQTLFGGRRYLRMEVRSGDNASWDKAGHRPVDRAEVVARAGPIGVIAYGQEFWQEWSMLIEDGEPITSNWCLLWQNHQLAEHPRIKVGVNPPFCFALHTEGEPGLVVLTRHAAMADVQPNGYIKPTKVYVDPAYPRGKWVKWRCRVRYGWQNDALLQIWRDDVLVVDLTQPGFGLGYEWDSDGGHGAYAQFGIYRATGLPTNPAEAVSEHRLAVHYRDYNLTVGPRN